MKNKGMFPDTSWNRFVAVANHILLDHDDNKIEQSQYLAELYANVLKLYNVYPKEYQHSNIVAWHSSWMQMTGLEPMSFMYLYPGVAFISDTYRNDAEKFRSWIETEYQKLE